MVAPELVEHVAVSNNLSVAVFPLGGNPNGCISALSPPAPKPFKAATLEQKYPAGSDARTGRPAFYKDI